MINTYGYIVGIGKGTRPIHIIEVRSTMRACFHVFPTSREAQSFLSAIKREMALVYDPDFKFSAGLMKLFQSSDLIQKGNELFIVSPRKETKL